MAEVLPRSNIRILDISKNYLGDDSLIYLADNLLKYEEICPLNKIDFSTSRVGDNGILYFLEKVQNLPNLQY